MTQCSKKLFSISASPFLQEMCKPFQHLNLISFIHDITFGAGQVSMLVSIEELFMFYYKNKVPLICTDSSGRNLKDGIYLNRTLESNYKDCSILLPVVSKTVNQYSGQQGKNSLHIVVREGDCQHLYSLSFDLEEEAFLHWIINNGSFLSDFIDNYNDSAKDIILEAKAPENRILLPYFNENKISIPSGSSGKNHARVTVYHKTMNVPIHLSAQQSKCLLLIMQGKTAKDIALKMHLSCRTVEYYIVIIRNLLGCSSTKELILSYANQLT